MRDHRSFRDSGVRTSFLLAIVRDAKETYEILVDLLQRVSLPAKWIFVGDLKIINLALVIQPHDATFPCPYCNWRSGGAENSMRYLEHRTFKSIKALSDKYKAQFLDPSAAAARWKLRDFLGCEFGPIPGVFPDTGRVLSFIPLSELHLLLGIVNKLYDELFAAKSCAGIARAWAVHLSVSQTTYRGEFNGNDCACLVSEAGVEAIAAVIAANADNVSFRVRRRRHSREVSLADRYLRAFQAFGALVHGIFGAELNPDWQNLIADFCSAYLALCISITPKVHSMFVHLSEWIDEHGCSRSLLGADRGGSTCTS